MYVLAFLII